MYFDNPDEKNSSPSTNSIRSRRDFLRSRRQIGTAPERLMVKTVMRRQTIPSAPTDRPTDGAHGCQPDCTSSGFAKSILYGRRVENANPMSIYTSPPQSPYDRFVAVLASSNEKLCVCACVCVCVHAGTLHT